MNPLELQPFSFGANDSPNDYRTVSSTQLSPIDPALASEGKVDFSAPPLSTMYDQHQVGECTGCGTGKAAEHDFKIGLSHDWLYLMGKTLVDGNLEEGSAILSMLKTANRYGIPSQAVCDKYPIDIQGGYAKFISDFNSIYLGKVPQEILDDASKNRIPGYYSVPVDPLHLANELAKGNPLIIRLAVGDNTYTKPNGTVSWSAADLLPLRAPNPATGGHCICLNEYKGLDLNQWLSGPNSWGTRWCPETGGYVNFIYGTQKPYFTEAWAIDVLPPMVQHQVQVLPPPPQTFWQKFCALMFAGGFKIINNKWVYAPKTK